MIHRIIPF